MISGVTLHFEPGHLAFDCEFARNAHAVRQAVTCTAIWNRLRG